MNRKRTLPAVLLTAIALTGCTSMATQPDQAGLQYGAGPIESTEFATCVDPGQREYGGVFDEFYAYPSGTRTFTFDDPGDRPVIDIADRDGQPLTVAGILTFQLNTDCETLQRFHEQIGLKYGASADGVQDWNELLNDYLGQPLRAAMRDVAGEYGWRELYSDPTVQDAFAGRVLETLPGYVEDLGGGDFFTNFTLLPQTPQPGSGLLNQIEEQNTQVERLNTIEAQRAAQDAEIEQMRQLVELLGQDGYLAYRNQLQCEENSDSCVPYLPIPAGGGVIVQPGGN